MYIDYPNPVLSSVRDDYNENCFFDVSFKEEDITVDETDILVPAICELQCAGLTDLIEHGQAAIVVHISSSASFYRRTYIFDAAERAQTIKIPKFDVRRSINFCGYILATKDISDFRCDGEFNDLYFRNVSFSVKKADVLAQGQTRSIPIDDTELEKPISSIFSIRKNTHSEAQIEAYFDDVDEKIVVYLNEQLNQLYYDMKDFNNGIMHKYLNGVIAYPVLVEAISKMCDYYRETGVDYSEKRWFKVIDHKLKAMNIDLSTEPDKYSYVDLADQLLGGISYEGLLSVKDTINEEANGGEYINTGGMD